MKKTILTLAIAVVLCFQQVLATPTQNTSVLQNTETTFTENESVTPPNVQQSEAALLLDMNSGRILYGKNIDKRVFPASTTKIMTGILAIELGNFEDTVTASAEALAPITMYDSQIGLRVGENLSLEQLVNALLVPSANDAANVIAVHIAGSMDTFVAIMNQKAKELGMDNTHFVNTCGMHDDNHYTTARDLSILAQYAMKNETFRNIVKKSTYIIPVTNKCPYDRVLSSTNLFLSSEFHNNPLCTGIKTGHTSKAGYCLVSSAQKDGMNLMSVVMGCENEDLQSKAYSYTNSKTLYDFGFNNYENKTLATPGDIVCSPEVYEAKDKMSVSLTVDTAINALISKGDFDSIETKYNLPEQISAPITAGSVLGTVSYSYKGTLLGVANLVATNDVERNDLLHIIHIITGIIFNPFFFIPAIIIILIILIRNRNRRKRQRRKNRYFATNYRYR